MVDRNDFTDDLDEDQEDGQEAEHPADPATVPQSPPATVTVPLSKEERLNMSVRMTLLMDEKKGYKEEVLKLNRACKNLDKEIETLAIAVRTNCKEVQADNPQQDLLTQGVGPEVAAASFRELAKAAETAAEAAEAASWTPEHHHADCPAKQGPLHACVPACGWNKAHGGPVEEVVFEASHEELAAQSGRRKGKKVA